MLIEKMQKTKKILRSIKTVIPFLFLASVFYSILYQIIFLNIPELFPFANEFGIITFNLSLAVAASSIFYFIVIHIFEYNNKQKALSIVRKKVQRLIDIEKTVTKAVADKSDEQLSKENYSEENFKKLFSVITVKDVTPKLFFDNKEKRNWLDYMFYFVNDTQFIIKEIYQFMPYLELDLLIILDELESCKYFNFFKIISNMNYTYPNLSIIANHYYDYTTLISMLEDYLIKIDKYFS